MNCLLDQHRKTEFIQRQKELQSLQNQMKALLDEIGQEKNDSEIFSEEEEQEEDIYEIMQNDEITERQEIRILAHEIQDLISEVKKVQFQLNKQRSSKNKDRVDGMNHQLDDLKIILNGQAARIKSLFHELEI